jgi:hypothetical protein
MDKKVRGFLEQAFDEFLGAEDIVSEIRWVQDEIPVSSLAEVALGFVIGALIGISEIVNVVKKAKRTKKEEDADSREIKLMIKRRPPEILQEINKELGR